MAKLKKIPRVDFSLCMACSICVTACPFGCLDMALTGKDQYNKAYPDLIFPEECTGCGICAHECPFDAISMVIPPQ
jgi:Pyruvate/2-oxoacid:ferredoxin oxidoreductase delta subunit